VRPNSRKQPFRGPYASRQLQNSLHFLPQAHSVQSAALDELNVIAGLRNKSGFHPRFRSHEEQLMLVRAQNLRYGQRGKDVPARSSARQHE
jgi:hypothetical protein